MVLVYLVLIVVMMFVGGMLIQNNPTPVEYVLAFGGHSFTVQSSLLELIGWSAVAGAVLMMAPYLQAVWSAARERRRLTREAADLRSDNTELRRDAENARSNARLLEARVAEAEERYAQLQAETQLLLTARQDEPEPAAEAMAEPEPAPASPRPVTSRWRKR